MENSKKDGKLFLGIGILLLVIGIGLGAWDVYCLTQFERVESQLIVRRSSRKGKKAHVSYEYQGQKYENKVLSSYNAFTMKSGKAYTVLIDPEHPDRPHATTFALDTFFVIFGIITIYAEIGSRKRVRNEDK